MSDQALCSFEFDPLNGARQVTHFTICASRHNCRKRPRPFVCNTLQFGDDLSILR